jgi:hypothetical protein
LFVGNLTVSSSQAYSGSIFNTKVYSTFTSGFSNFKTISQRINKPIPARASSALALIVAGGGAGGTLSGGGAGGILYTSLPLTFGNITVIVGDGGSSGNGQNSSIGSVIATGGGKGGGAYAIGNNGGSGGGGSPSGSGTAGQGFDGNNQVRVTTKEVAEVELDKNHPVNLEVQDLSFLYFHRLLDHRYGLVWRWRRWSLDQVCL